MHTSPYIFHYSALIRLINLPGVSTRARYGNNPGRARYLKPVDYVTHARARWLRVRGGFVPA